MTMPHAYRDSYGSRRRIADDEGSIGISSYFAVMTLLLLLGLGIAGMRTFIGQADVSAASRAAARAAAIEHSYADAVTAANNVVTTELASTGLACTNTSVSVDTSASDFGPGGLVEVTVDCTVSFVGLFVPWSTAGEKALTATGTEPIDCLRGDWDQEVECAGY